MGTTYAKLDTYTVGAGGIASVTFNNISQDYTDLIIKMSVRSSTTENWINLSINTDTTAFINRQILGDGSSVAGFSVTTNLTALQNNNGFTASTFANADITFGDYTNLNTYKSMSVDAVSENNGTTSYTLFNASTWRSQAPITTITLTANSGSFAQYSTFTVYGVMRYDITAVPTAPTIGAVSPGAGTASVAFTGTTNAGSYTVVSSPGGLTQTGQTSPIAIGGLTNGTAYTFTVRGNNGFGAGTASSASSSVTPQNLAGYWFGGSQGFNGGILTSQIAQLSYNYETVMRLNQSLTISTLQQGAFANSAVAGYCAGGSAAGALYAGVDKLTFATTTKSITNSIPQAKAGSFAHANSGTAGYVSMGEAASPAGRLNTTVKMAFSADTWTTVAATTPNALDRGSACANSGTAGYMFGGNQGGSSVNTVFKMLYSNDSISTLSGTLTYNSYTSTAVSNNGTAGYYCGGYNGSMITQIDKIAFPSDTKSGISAKLASGYVSADAGAHSYSGGAGYIGAGYDSDGFSVIPSGSNTGSKSQINRLAYSNETISVLSATMLNGPSLLDANGCANSGVL
jgi:hypothetical protein